MNRRLRVMKVSDSLYKLEIVACSAVYAEQVARAMRNALAISGLTVAEFFRELLRLLDISPDDAVAVFANAGLTMEAGAQAVMAGDVIPAADVLLVAAIIAGTTVGILLDESPIVEEVRGLAAQIRRFQAGSPLISRDGTEG